jgi:pimeloyl-ACP methyl ester carboxylesterase
MHRTPIRQTRIERPPLYLLGTEPIRALREFVAHKLSRGPRGPSGDGHPVVIFPGMATDGRAVAPLRAHCEALGYTALDWGLGFNTGPQGDVDAWTRELAAHVRGLLKGFRSKATLIGWSLGGLYARELAKILRPRIRQVITIGTPFNAELDHTNVGWIYRLLTGSDGRVDPALSARLRTPPPVPTTSIYSKSDGVVAWPTCRHDKRRPHVEDIEIEGSHLGMGWNSRVLDVISDRLAQRPRGWRRYAA